MAKKDFRQFKVGDILCPLPSRHRCYDYGITKLKKVIVTYVNNNIYGGGSNSSQQLKLKILEGVARNFQGMHTKGDMIYGFNDGYQLYNGVTEDYEIY